MVRFTKQRKMILEELRKVTTHPTADEVYQMVRKRLPRVSLATVYRNLEMLSSVGEIGKIEVAGTQRRYDGMAEDHCHVRCLECGRVDDCMVDPVTDIEKRADAISDYTITGHRVEFKGVCPDCRDRDKTVN